jgi:hypothetical protein
MNKQDKSPERKLYKRGSIKQIFCENSGQDPHPNKNEVWDY